MTKWTFRHVLLKRAYTIEEFVCMAAQSRFGMCQINVAPIGFEVRLMKPTHVAAGVAYCLSPAETADTVL
jgi:hypothetical protein